MRPDFNFDLDLGQVDYLSQVRLLKIVFFIVFNCFMPLWVVHSVQNFLWAVLVLKCFIETVDLREVGVFLVGR